MHQQTQPTEVCPSPELGENIFESRIGLVFMKEEEFIIMLVGHHNNNDSNSNNDKKKKLSIGKERLSGLPLLSVLI